MLGVRRDDRTMDDETTINGVLAIVVVATSIWLGSVGIAAPVPMPGPAPIEDSPQTNPARFASVFLGAISDTATTAIFDGERLVVAYRCLNIEQIAELVPAVFRRFPQVKSIEVIGQDSPQRVRGKTTETFDEPFVSLTFTRAAATGEAVKVMFSNLPKPAAYRFWAHTSRYHGGAPELE
jgi:hypothetical protein